MAENSKIAWTTHTFNPWIGCTKVHEGCAHCYAEGMAKRTGKAIWGPSGTRSKTSNEYWSKPMKWARDAENAAERPRVFCASMADIFEDWQGPILDHLGNEICVCHGCGKHVNYLGDCGGSEPKCGRAPRRLVLDDLRRELFGIIDATPNLDWLLLTKRPENVWRMLGRGPFSSRRYWPNVWLGTSISNQKTAEEFVSRLVKCGELAPVLFISAEPLLGRIDLTRLANGGGETYDALRAEVRTNPSHKFRTSDTAPIKQVIIGVESRGPYLGSLGDFKSEAAWIDAAESLVAQCAAAKVACFVKQIPVNGKLSHDPNEWPEDLRVRQFPAVTTAV